MRDESPDAEVLLGELSWLRALAQRLVRDPHRAEDAVQDVMVAALSRRLPRGAHRVRSLRRWLAAVLRNAVRQTGRGHARRVAREARSGRAEAEPSALEVVAELSWHRRVVELVHELEEPYRTAIAWRYLHGCSPREIARRLDVPVKTVHTRIERGLVRLRARLDRESGGRDAWLAGLLPIAYQGTGALGALPGGVVLAMNMNSKVVAVGLGLLLVASLLYVPFRAAASRDARAEASAAELVRATGGGEPPAADRPEAERRAVAPAAAPPPAPAAAPRVEPVAPLVAGVVLDLQGRGVAELAVVLVTDAGERVPAARSTRDGSFELPLPAIEGRLEVANAEWASVVRPYLRGAPPAMPPVVVVAPRRDYAGRVVDAYGHPIAGARIEATLDGPWLSSSALEFAGPANQTVHLLLPLAETRSDADGAFAFDALGLVPGAHLVARRDGFDDGRAELPERSRADLEIVLEAAAAPERALHGIVYDAAGAPVEDALVSLGWDSVRSAPDGRFALALEDWQSSGTLRAVKLGHQPGELRCEWGPGQPGAEATAPLGLYLGPAPLEVRGRVVDARGAPVAGATVWSPDSTFFGRVEIDVRGKSVLGHTTAEALATGDTESADGPRLAIEAHTGTDGRYVLAGLAPRGYAVYALDPRTLAASEPVVVEAGTEGLELRLAGGALRRVAGRVVSAGGRPLEGVRISTGRAVPWPDAPPPRTDSWEQAFLPRPSGAQTFLDRFVLTDADGRFEHPGLHVEGSYLLLTGASIVLSERVALEDRDDLEELEIRVEASSRFRVALRDPSEADAFDLVGPGDRVQPLYVEVDGHRISTGQVAIVEGRSGVVQSPEGTHTLKLTKDGEEVRRVEVELQPGGVYELQP